MFVVDHVHIVSLSVLSDRDTRSFKDTYFSLSLSLSLSLHSAAQRLAQVDLSQNGLSQDGLSQNGFPNPRTGLRLVEKRSVRPTTPGGRDANRPSNMHLREMWLYAPTPSTLATVADVLLSAATRSIAECSRKRLSTRPCGKGILVGRACLLQGRGKLLGQRP